jgi:hypothetical protein
MIAAYGSMRPDFRNSRASVRTVVVSCQRRHHNRQFRGTPREYLTCNANALRCPRSGAYLHRAESVSIHGWDLSPTNPHSQHLRSPPLRWEWFYSFLRPGVVSSQNSTGIFRWWSAYTERYPHTAVRRYNYSIPVATRCLFDVRNVTYIRRQDEGK